VYDEICSVGEQFGLVHAGYHALNSLRMEKGYRHWGHDITDEDTPLEAGLGFAVKLEKEGGFIGQDALLNQKQRGLERRMLQFRLDDPQPLLYHNEPIWRDDRIVGYISSGAYGHTLGSCIALGYVKRSDQNETEEWVTGKYEIEVAGQRFSAQASLAPMFDPKNEKIRC
jgi:4-methylaminobutanoate oxidase (formaldehyde-forming)